MVRRETGRRVSLFLAASSRYGCGMGEPTGGMGQVDEHLAETGYASGVRGVVRRFLERSAALQELALRWHPEPPTQGVPLVESALHPGGQFYLEAGVTGIGKLVHVWPGWGRRTIGTGNPDHLRSEATRLLRRGGPFGGPTIARSAERIVQVHDPHRGMRQPMTDGGESRVRPLGQKALAVRIWPDGKFAQAQITNGQGDPDKMIEDDAEYLSFGGARTPWTFTDLHPLMGVIRADPYDLLLCPLQVDLVAVLALKGDELLGFNMGGWDETRAMDAGPWLADLAVRSSKAKAEATAAPKTPETGKAKKPSKATRPATAATTKKPGRPASAAPDDGEGQGQGGQAGDKPASKRRRRVATSPGGMPGPRARRVRVKPVLAAAITQHLASVAAGLPVGVLGAAFAVELLRALEAAALSDHPSATGTMAELFSRLHKRGFLSSIPADQAGRAALKLLAERTPLVRRFHYRRWCFPFGDMHDPGSALRARLGPIVTE